MKVITLTLFSAFTLITIPKVSAQTKTNTKKTSVVRKASPRNANNTKVASKNLSQAEISIEEINARLNAIDDEADGIKTIARADEMNYFTEQLLNVAGDYKGTRYVWGGMSRSGMDCSGFVKTAYDQFNVNLPRTSREMAAVGTRVTKENAKPGDLIFFRNDGKKVINHVGIVVEATEGEIKFIHSSSSRGVIVSSTNEAYYKRGFAQINRVYDRKMM